MFHTPPTCLPQLIKSSSSFFFNFASRCPGLTPFINKDDTIVDHQDTAMRYEPVFLSVVINARQNGFAIFFEAFKQPRAVSLGSQTDLFHRIFFWHPKNFLLHELFLF